MSFRSKRSQKLEARWQKSEVGASTGRTEKDADSAESVMREA